MKKLFFVFIVISSFLCSCKKNEPLLIPDYFYGTWGIYATGYAGRNWIDIDKIDRHSSKYIEMTFYRGGTFYTTGFLGEHSGGRYVVSKGKITTYLSNGDKFVTIKLHNNKYGEGILRTSYKEFTGDETQMTTCQFYLRYLTLEYKDKSIDISAYNVEPESCW